MTVFCRVFLPLLLSLPAGVAAAAQPGESAAAKANHCVGCHNIPGYRSVFPEVYPVPKIIGQSAKYIETALRAYRDGTRTHPSMTGIAAQLSDEDIRVLAEWYAGGAK
ncbi:MAG: c-type cytochrome [Gammaproteobacteria bacterium]